MTDKTWMTPEQLAKRARAFDVQPEEFRSPIPTQNVSNGDAPALGAIAQGPTAAAFGFPTNRFTPDGFKDEANSSPYWPWNPALAAQYLADPAGYVDSLTSADAFHFLQFIKSIYLDSQ